MELLVGIVALIGVAYLAWRMYAEKVKRNRLMEKYSDEEIVQRIMDAKVWQGMSAEQLVDSWGRPAAIDEKVYKTKTVYTYKYNQVGRNRFRSRVQVENGVVVGWSQK